MLRRRRKVFTRKSLRIEPGKICVNGDVRIRKNDHVAADSPMYAEVFYKNHWYPICGDGFVTNNNGADTACKSLGFSSGVAAGAQMTQQWFYSNAMPVGKCNANEKLDHCSGGQNGFGNFEYNNRFCASGPDHKVGVQLTCSGASGVVYRSSCDDRHCGGAHGADVGVWRNHDPSDGIFVRSWFRLFRRTTFNTTSMLSCPVSFDVLNMNIRGITAC